MSERSDLWCAGYLIVLLFFRNSIYATIQYKSFYRPDGVSEALTTENLTEALARVQVDTEDPRTVAADFLAEYGLV